MCCYSKRIDVQGVANGMFVFGYRHGSSIPPVAAFQRIIQHFGWGVQDLVLVLHWKFGQKHMIYELYTFMSTFIIIADGRFLAFYVALVQTQVLSTSVVQNIHPSVEDKRCKTYFLNMTVSVRGILSYTTTGTYVPGNSTGTYGGGIAFQR